METERDYTEKDLEASLRRAFVGEGGADFITFDGHTARKTDFFQKVFNMV